MGCVTNGNKGEPFRSFPFNAGVCIIAQRPKLDVPLVGYASVGKREAIRMNNGGF